MTVYFWRPPSNALIWHRFDARKAPLAPSGGHVRFGAGRGSGKFSTCRKAKIAPVALWGVRVGHRGTIIFAQERVVIVEHHFFDPPTDRHPWPNPPH